MIAFLEANTPFPDPNTASAEGLLAIGGDLSVDRLMQAYNHGIFPWYSQNDPIMWWSPDPRMVLFPEELKVSKSFAKTLRSGVFRVSFNMEFERVINACAKIPRADQQDTWITQEMQDAYIDLHREGHAQSVEVYLEEQLVGGLYGINLRKQGVFCGESMFSTVSNASKVGFHALVTELKAQQYRLLDCQMHTDHLASLGAREIPRTEFLKYLK